MRSLTFDRPPRPRDRTTDGATMDDRTSLFFERDQLGAL